MSEVGVAAGRMSRRSRSPRRAGRHVLVAVVATVLGVLVGAAPAAAHPLGNFSVNTATAVAVGPDRIGLDVVVDLAEIPTLQAFPDADEGAVDEATAAAYAQRECPAVADEVTVTVAGEAVPLDVVGRSVTFPPGTAGLPTTRLECRLEADGVATQGRTVTVATTLAEARVGWHEVTAAGDGMALRASDVPRRSPSARLTAYPEDLLSSPLDVRSARLEVGSADGSAVPGADAARGGTGGVFQRVSSTYTDLVGAQDLSLGFGLLAVVLSVVLGAAHAVAPGHGKTLMAAYLVGRDGSLRQAGLIGLSVTVTHTAGVLALGAVLAAVSLTAPERIYGWLGLAGALLLVGIGTSLLLSARRRRAHRHAPDHRPLEALVDAPAGAGAVAAAGSVPGHHTHDHGHGSRGDHGHEHGHGQDLGHGHGHGHDHGHDHGLDHDPGHAHDHGLDHDPGHAHDHGHDAVGEHAHGPFRHTHAPPPTSWRGLVGVGFAGGLVPSPSALLVLLGGIALHRAWFGVVLVVAYGVGMAVALVAIGLLLVRARDALSRWVHGRPGAAAARLATAARSLPEVTAALVIAVGVLAAARSLTGLV